MCACGGGCPNCCPRPTTLYQRLCNRLAELEGDTRSLVCGIWADDQTRMRRGVELVKKLDKLRRECEDAGHYALAKSADEAKIKIGERVFKIAPTDLARMERSSNMSDLERAERALAAAEKALETAQERLAKELARPQDDYEPGTYLIAERKPEMPEYVWGPPRVFSKDAEGQWWSSNQTSGPVGWGVVLKVLEDERLDVYAVEAMAQVH